MKKVKNENKKIKNVLLISCIAAFSFILLYSVVAISVNFTPYAYDLSTNNTGSGFGENEESVTKNFYRKRHYGDLM